MIEPTYCSQPRQCIWQHTCKRNLDNHKGPMPAVRIYQLFISAPDEACPGFVELSESLTPTEDDPQVA